MKAAANFSGQLRSAADDATVSEQTLRQGLRDAADVIDSQQQLTYLQLIELDRQRLWIGILVGLILTAIGGALGVVAVMERLLPCPCGTLKPVMLWRRGASNRYTMRCPSCHRQSDVATVDFEQLNALWNATIRRVCDEGMRK